MPLGNYSELQSSVASWINRDDLTAQIPDFVRLAEVRISKDFKTQHLITDTSITTDASLKALPSNNRGIISAYLSTNPKTRLDYFTPDEFINRQAASETGKPLGYTIKGQNIHFAPSPDSSYSCIVSHYSTPSLATDDTNSLLTNYPDLYLYATLVEAAEFIEEDATRWQNRYGLALVAALDEDDYLGALSIQLGDAS